MKAVAEIDHADVSAVYDGHEGDLWELIMGQQIHIGGFRSSMELAERAGVGAQMHGAGYSRLLTDTGCDVLAAEDTGRFSDDLDLYHNMVDMQLTYDALRILAFDIAAVQSLAGEMEFLRTLAHAGKVAQGRFIARRR